MHCFHELVRFTVLYPAFSKKGTQPRLLAPNHNLLLWILRAVRYRVPYEKFLGIITGLKFPVDGFDQAPEQLTKRVLR
jgi:hypothetical protein